MDSLIELIKKETLYLFQDAFYQNITNKILNHLHQDEAKEGYVYFIKNGHENGNVKIGCAINIDNRIKSYSTSFDKKIFIVGYIKAKNYYNLEKEIHSYFLNKKVKGEWFNLDAYDFIDLKSQYDFIDVHNFYVNSKKITELEKGDYLPYVSSDFIDFAKTLETDKIYYPGSLCKKFEKEYNKKINTSWFGRELNKAIVHLGYKKINSTNGGIRSFKIF